MLYPPNCCASTPELEIVSPKPAFAYFPATKNNMCFMKLVGTVESGVDVGFIRNQVMMHHMLIHQVF